MTVLHTIASLDPTSGGPARSVPQLLQSLKTCGADVALWVAAPPRPEWTSALRVARISVYSAEEPDPKGIVLLHDHGLWLSSNHRIARFATRHGIPRVVSPRGMLEPWALNHRKWKKRLAWWLYQRGDLRKAVALHATAESEEAQFRKLGLKMPVFIIPNGVDLPEPLKAEGGTKPEGSGAEDYDEVVARRATPLSGRNVSSNLKTEVRTALFLGRIHPKKGLPMLVEAWAKVRPPGWQMRVAGPDECGHGAEIAAMIRDEGLEDTWSLEGEVSDEGKWEVFSGADLFILPTHSENFGISVAEALASGLPVITTTGAPWKGLFDHRCGWWVAPSAETLAHALAEATSSGSYTLREMGLRGRTWMADEFSWKGVAESMSTAYKTLIRTAP
jgi:glycosyltransferase involved in cell wall biosynthesis